MKKTKSNLIQYSLFDCMAPSPELTEPAVSDNYKDSVCREWQSCGYSDKCFAPDNDKSEDPVCFKERETQKGSEAIKKSLADLCRNCHEAAMCKKCCVACHDQCNGKQLCRWPESDKRMEPEKHRDLPIDGTEFGDCFSRDEKKILSAGFCLVRYIRDEKLVQLADPLPGSNAWGAPLTFPTYAAAERQLKAFKDDGCIEVDATGKVIMSGWFQPEGLKSKGFEFYRVYGLRAYEGSGPFCIKIGSKNWSNFGKYPDRAALQSAWDELMKDPKALEG